MTDREHAVVDSLALGNLHLGVKTRLLENAGYRTVGDLRTLGIARIAGLPSIGRRTVDDLVRNRDALNGAVTRDGIIDWQAYCDATQRPLIPLTSRPASGAEFLQSLWSFVSDLVAVLDDDVLSAILLERICQPPNRQRTLEELGTAAAPPVTRERIRQREKKLLGQIAGGLLNDSYDGLDIHFRPDFSRWWRMAADALADQDDIEVSSFVALLSDIWDVPPGAIREQLPVIVAIVTGEPQLSAGFRFVAKIDSRLFGEVREELRHFPILRLRIGKAALRLWEAEIGDAYVLLERLGSGELEALGSSIATKAAGHLNLIAECLTEDGKIDWQSYRTACDIACLPARSPANAGEFTAGLFKDVEELLRLHQVTKRATDIFRFRTGQDARNRMTLQRVGDRLGTFQSTIKREETDFLVWLNDVLIGGEFWKLEVWLDRQWLHFWAEAENVFEHSAKDYDRFADNLAWRWRLTRGEIGAAAPVLWAVLTGYPDGRPSAWQPTDTFADAPAPAGRIRLRGFRRQH